MQFYTVFSQENFFLSTLSTGRCRKPVDVDKSFSNLCRSWQVTVEDRSTSTKPRQKPANVDMSSPKTCRRPSTSTCRRRQGFDKKVQGFTFSATWGECRQACRRRQRWRRERNFFDKDGEGRRCRRQQALVDVDRHLSTACWRRQPLVDVEEQY